MSSKSEENILTKLVPINPESKEVLHDRPTLIIQRDPPVLLGDNDSTGIVDPALSHFVVKVYKKGTKIYAFCFKDSRGGVVVNGRAMYPGERRELKNGDLVALTDGSDSTSPVAYEYRVRRTETVRLTPDTADSATVAAAAVARAVSSSSVADADPAAQRQPQLSEEAMESIRGETECSICMEIMVEPSTIVPCGHSFCKDCLKHQSACAVCRGPIHTQVVCKNLENLIESMVKASNNRIFERNDVESYHSRTKRSSTSKLAGRPQRKLRLVTHHPPPVAEVVVHPPPVEEVVLLGSRGTGQQWRIRGSNSEDAIILD
jgi:hypothetical protein